MLCNGCVRNRVQPPRKGCMKPCPSDCMPCDQSSCSAIAAERFIVFGLQRFQVTRIFEGERLIQSLVLLVDVDCAFAAAACGSVGGCSVQLDPALVSRSCWPVGGVAAAEAAVLSAGGAFGFGDGAPLFPVAALSRGTGRDAWDA